MIISGIDMMSVRNDLCTDWCYQQASAVSLSLQSLADNFDTLAHWLFCPLANMLLARLFRFSCPPLARSLSQLSYVHGVPPAPISFSPMTMGQMLEKRAKQNPDRLAFIVVHQEIKKTYPQFNDDVRKFFECKKIIPKRFFFRKQKTGRSTIESVDSNWLRTWP